MKNILFICGVNKLRSPTAEQIFAKRPNIETDSAGLNADADQRVSPEQIGSADIIFVMEKSMRVKLAKQFRKYLNTSASSRWIVQTNTLSCSRN